MQGAGGSVQQPFEEALVIVHFSNVAAQVGSALRCSVRFYCPLWAISMGDAAQAKLYSKSVGGVLFLPIMTFQFGRDRTHCWQEVETW